MRVAHRAEVKSRNLVVVQVGGDHRLGSVGILHHAHVAAVDPVTVEPLLVGAEILADRAHRHAIAAEQFEAVGNVARTATELAAHVRRDEAHVQHVNVLRQDVRLEVIREHQDRVVRKRATDQCRHGVPCVY